MKDIHGRFDIRDDFDAKAKKISVLFWVDGKCYQFGVMLPWETIKEFPDLSDNANVEFAGLGKLPEKELV